MSHEKELVSQLYTQCLTVNNQADSSAVLGKILAEDFKSINAAETKSKTQLIGQLKFFWTLIPNLKWEIQEMLQDANRVIVRGMASGSPKGNFMGMELDGSKSFKIMSIDIHTVVNNQIKEIYHLEEWTTAIQQLKA